MLKRFSALVAEKAFKAGQDAAMGKGWRHCAEGQHSSQFCGQLNQAVIRAKQECAMLCFDLGNSGDGYDCFCEIVQSVIYGSDTYMAKIFEDGVKAEVAKRSRSET